MVAHSEYHRQGRLSTPTCEKYADIVSSEIANPSHEAAFGTFGADPKKLPRYPTKRKFLLGWKDTNPTKLSRFVGFGVGFALALPLRSSGPGAPPPWCPAPFVPPCGSPSLRFAPGLSCAPGLRPPGRAPPAPACGRARLWAAGAVASGEKAASPLVSRVTPLSPLPPPANYHPGPDEEADRWRRGFGCSCDPAPLGPLAYRTTKKAGGTRRPSAFVTFPKSPIDFSCTLPNTAGSSLRKSWWSPYLRGSEAAVPSRNCPWSAPAVPRHIFS